MQNISSNDIANIRSFGRLSLSLAILTFILMALGSTVRAHDAGLACPDWPMCFGQVVPAMDLKIFLEWFHRLIALVLGICLVRMLFRLYRFQMLRRAFAKEMSALIVLFLIQCILGGLTVLKLLDPSVVSSHLLTALTFFSVLLWIWRHAHHIERARVKSRMTAIQNSAKKWLVLSSVLMFLQIAVGGMVSTNYAGLVCPDFPTCHGQWFPYGTHLIWMQMGHRYFAFALFGLAIFLRFKFKKNALPQTAHLALQLFPLLLAIQILLGAMNIFLAIPKWVTILHHANAVFMYSLLFIGALDLVLIARATAVKWIPKAHRLGEGNSMSSHTLTKDKPEARAGFRDYLAMTKPTITLLVVVTTLPGLVLASPTLPSIMVLLSTFLGTGMLSASAAIFNQICEEDVDQHMQRTYKRALPSGKVSTKEAVIFAGIFGCLGFWLLWQWGHPLAAVTALGAHLFYIFVYTLFLKRRTAQNIVIGGVAGAVGPLIGWAAVTGDIGWPAWVLFIIITLWTPPHFWALALKYKEDYRKAKIPMYPVVHGDHKTRLQIMLYSLSLIPFVLSLYLLNVAGILYLIVSGFFAFKFGWDAIKLYLSKSNDKAMPFFHFSCTYTFVIFGALTFDRLITFL